MKIKNGFAIREICGEYILIPLGENALTYSGMLTTNEVGVSIWNYLQEEHTKEDLVEYMFSEYEVEEEVLKKDIDNFLERVEKLNLFEN